VGKLETLNYIVPALISLIVAVLSTLATKWGMAQQAKTKSDELALDRARYNTDTDLSMYDRVIAELREVKAELDSERMLRRDLEARVKALEDENREIREENEALRECNDRTLEENKALRIRVRELEQNG
jgi:hypothetical protein